MSVIVDVSVRMDVRVDVRIDGCGYGGEGVTDMYSGIWVLFWVIACACGGRDECDGLRVCTSMCMCDGGRV